MEKEVTINLKQEQQQKEEETYKYYDYSDLNKAEKRKLEDVDETELPILAQLLRLTGLFFLVPFMLTMKIMACTIPFLELTFTEFTWILCWYDGTIWLCQESKYMNEYVGVMAYTAQRMHTNIFVK